MAYEKILMSNFGLSVSTTSGGTYTTISGINNLTFEVDTADVETTTFDNNLWASRMAGIKTAGITAEGLRIADSTTGARDAGQKLAEKAAVNATLHYWRLYWKTDPTQYITVAGYAKSMGFGAGLNEAAPWNVEVLVDGTPTFTGAMFDPTL